MPYIVMYDEKMGNGTCYLSVFIQVIKSNSSGDYSDEPRPSLGGVFVYFLTVTTDSRRGDGVNHALFVNRMIETWEDLNLTSSILEVYNLVVK